MSLGTVLILDDEEIIIKPVYRALSRMFNQEKLDYDIVTGISPIEILEKVDNENIDLALVISDIMMAPMDGLKFLTEIRKRFPETLLIVLTGYTDPQTFNELNENIDLFSYQKKSPWEHIQFLRTVRNALNLYRRKKLLGQYVPEKIIEQVLKHPDNNILEGTELEATIMFLDFRDSSALFSNEILTPQQSFNLLNNYFNDMITILEKNNGILDKFMGDGLMALFGVPLPTQSPQNDAIDAVRAAIQMREAVWELNKTNKTHPLSFGIGISSGSVIAGNVGSVRSMNYTVLGHAVNVASRLEKAAKQTKDSILISQHTYEYIQAEYETRPYTANGFDIPMHEVIT